jgi:hypothetical protein
VRMLRECQIADARFERRSIWKRALASSRQLTLNFRMARDTSRTCNLDDAAFHHPLQVSEYRRSSSAASLTQTLWRPIMGHCGRGLR